MRQLYHSVYTKNFLPYCTLPDRKSLLEVVRPATNMSAERALFRPFGEPVWCFNYEEKHKLRTRAIEGRIVGYHGIHGVYKAVTKSGKGILTKFPKHRSLIPTTQSYGILPLPSIAKSSPESTPEEHLPQKSESSSTSRDSPQASPLSPKAPLSSLQGPLTPPPQIRPSLPPRSN